MAGLNIWKRKIRQDRRIVSRDFYTRTKVRIAIVEIRPIDVELIIVPVRIRNVAIGIARTSCTAFFCPYHRKSFSKFSGFLPRTRHCIEKSRQFLVMANRYLSKRQIDFKAENIL